MFKKFFFLFFVMSFFSVFVFSQGQNVVQNDNQTDLNQVVQDNSVPNEFLVPDSFSLIADNQVSLQNGQSSLNQNVQNPSKFSTFFLFLKMIIVLGIVIACVYIVLYFMKRSMKTDKDDENPFLRKVSAVDLAVGKSVQIVTLVDKAYIVGVSDNSVNLIAEVEDKELIQAMNLYADKKNNTKKPKSFADVLDIFMPNGPRDDNKSILSGFNSKIDELLKKQKERSSYEKN